MVKSQRGQVALYLVVALVALAVLMLSNVGAFLAVRAKNRAMNAGDAAALAAARRQGELLNEIGHLNLRHAEAEWIGDWDAALEIVNQQRRIAFLGPLDCLRAANEAAKANGASADTCECASLSRILSKHASTVRTLYAENPDLYPEPWEGAWDEYAASLLSLAASGMVVGCDNIEFLNAVECFPLTSKSFYSMIEGGSWCKLVVAGWTWLLNIDLHNLPPPMKRAPEPTVNSEICPLHLTARIPLLATPYDLDQMRALFALNGASFPESEGDEKYPAEDDRPPDDPSRVYFFYDEWRWSEWSPLISRANLPLVGTVKPEFDVRGCCSVFRVSEIVPQFLSDSKRVGAWNAAAKPFGRALTSAGQVIVTHEETMGIVLPAFEAVRLIPIALADGGNDLSTADEQWLDHVRDHVPLVFEGGTDALSSTCRYCMSLKKWDDPEFRSRVASWVERNAETCRRSHGGNTPPGGTSYAH